MRRTSGRFATSRCRAPFVTITRRASSPAGRSQPFILVPTVFSAQDGTSIRYTSAGRRLRRVRKRKDGRQSQRRQVPGRGRRQLDYRLADQSAVSHFYERHPDVDRREQQFQARLQPEQRVDAGSPGRRRRLLRADQQSELRQAGSATPTIRRFSQRLGHQTVRRTSVCRSSRS